MSTVKMDGSGWSKLTALTAAAWWVERQNVNPQYQQQIGRSAAKDWERAHPRMTEPGRSGWADCTPLACSAQRHRGPQSG